VSPQEQIEFEAYLRHAIQAAGFASPSQFARSVNLDPSVVLRWLSGIQRPTVQSLEKVAPSLGLSTADLVRAAYPDRLGHDGKPMGSPVNQLAHEIDLMLANDSPIPPDRRKELVVVLQNVLSSFRPEMRRSGGRARRASHTSRPGHAADSGGEDANAGKRVS
jgi:transcriptional regulator with XRE-family HTH domain